MALQQWAVPRLSQLLPLDESELRQLVDYSDSLPPAQAAEHLQNILGDSPQAIEFVSSFNEEREGLKKGLSKPALNDHRAPQNGGTAFADQPAPTSTKSLADGVNADLNRTDAGSDSKFHAGKGFPIDNSNGGSSQPPSYAPPSNPPPAHPESHAIHRKHTNQVIEAATIRARDEQEMQNLLQSLQFQYQIYNSDIEPEHETDYACGCPIHQYQRRKYARYGVQDMWSKAVMYPGEKAYNDNKWNNNMALFSGNPYRLRVISPYGMMQNSWGASRPQPNFHAKSVQQTINLNNSLNHEAQKKIDAQEPLVNIWGDLDNVDAAMSQLSFGDKKQPLAGDVKQSNGGYPDEKRPGLNSTNSSLSTSKPKASRFASFRQSIGIKTSEQKAVIKTEKDMGKGKSLRQQILVEEEGRWPDNNWRRIVENYQEKVGMTHKIADLRNRHPIQYLHLLRAGFFEPIPVAWANQASNPLKFSIEAAAGWRGITPAWRGYEDTAEERLYWVLNHRDGGQGARMKPDFISEMNMARERMASAVEPPPEYYSVNDVCHVQHTSSGYSKQVMPSPFKAFDRPEKPTDDTMILLDVSGSMDFDPVFPIYNQYLITHYAPSTQPKNKDVAKAIIRRFTDAMANHDHAFGGYDLVTFANKASFIGTVNHANLDSEWRKVKLGGGTRVMTGWQKVKELHFQKHSESATHHPVYGWQAGPETPMLRLLLLLDGEATDMDEFELDLLGLSWAHVTIFLIGVDGCPHHHRHANELSRISASNHHVSFVDAQGNTPERFVTHELLKRHLGYEISMQEFTQMEELPSYSAT